MPEGTNSLRLSKEEMAKFGSQTGSFYANREASSQVEDERGWSAEQIEQQDRAKELRQRERAQSELSGNELAEARRRRMEESKQSAEAFAASAKKDKDENPSLRDQRDGVIEAMLGHGEARLSDETGFKYLKRIQ